MSLGATEKLNWSTDVFVECYNAIKYDGNVNASIIQTIQNDLFSLLKTPSKQSGAGKITEEVEFSDGKFKLNSEFMEAATILSSDLDLDVIAAAELLHHARSTESFHTGIDLLDSAKCAFYTRFQYILNIAGFLISTGQVEELLCDGKNKNLNTFFDNIIISFERLYARFTRLNEHIDKQKATGDLNNLAFVASIKYAKRESFQSHEILAQIYYSLIDKYPKLNTTNTYKRVLDHMQKHLQDDDIFTVHYLPGLLHFIQRNKTDSEVEALHKFTVSRLTSDYSKISSQSTQQLDLSKSGLPPTEVVLSLISLTQFITWCKADPSRTTTYSFKDDILKYIEWCVTYGAFEKLLCISADTSTSATQLQLEGIYDFRSLLQKSFPRLTPLKLKYSGADELDRIANINGLANVSSLVSIDGYLISESFSNDLVAPFLHTFFSGFVSNAAVILTSLRDNEEDFLLSTSDRKPEGEEDEGELDEKDRFNQKQKSHHGGQQNNEDHSNEPPQYDLDEIASRSDLERFYLAYAYAHADRPNICNHLWREDGNTSKVNDLLGFISWGVTNNTSPLITATFSILLGSLSYGGDDSANRIWDILVNNNSNTLKKNDYSKVSVDSIADSLNYYVDSLNKNFKEDLQLKSQQQKKDFLFSNESSNGDNTDFSTSPILIELAEDSVVFITGFIQLLSAIVKNLSSSNERSREVKARIFHRFRSTITEFLMLDNLIIKTGTASSSGNNKQIFVSDSNRVVLSNLMLDLLSSFVREDDTSLTIRYEVWELLDKWIFQGLPLEENNNGLTSNSIININNNSGNRNIINSNTNSSNSNSINSNNISIRANNQFNGRVSQLFQLSLTQLSQVVSFTKLVTKLLRPLKNENKAFKQYRLLYPADLGTGYRANGQIGVWPYIEYLMLEVFSNSGELLDLQDRLSLQEPILEMIVLSLKEVDWKFLNDEAPATIRNNFNLNAVIGKSSELASDGISFQLFVKLHHSLAIMNYFFDERTYRALFKVVSMKEEDTTLATALEIIDHFLGLQDTFIHRLIPVLKNNDITPSSINGGPIGFGTSMSLALSTPKTAYDNIYYPKNIGLQGVTDFYEIFLFNLPVVANLGLLVGSSDINTAKAAISILHYISSSSFFVTVIDRNSTDPVLGKNRLLTTFMSIDESDAIKYAFMQQLDRSIEQFEDLEAKFSILNFLLENLPQSGHEPGVAHFLLGFQFGGGNTLGLDTRDSRNTLLKTLLFVLNSSLNSISQIDYNNGNIHVIDLAPAKLSAHILAILVKLCRDPISSEVTLNFLRNYEIESRNLFAKLIECQPKIDLSTEWASKPNAKFDGDLSTRHSNEFIQREGGSGPSALFSFIQHRNLILQYLSLEFHSTSKQGSLHRKEVYIDLLLNGNAFLDGSPRVLSFLDILNFRFENLETSKYEKFNQKYNIPIILDYMRQNQHVDSILDLSILEKIYKIICKSATGQLHNKEMRLSFSQEVMEEGSKIAEFLTKYVVYNDFKRIQLSCLHSWVQLIQVLLTDGTMSVLRKSNFILEIFSVILPKINDYLEFDIQFAEELISLSVLLFDLYEKDNLKDTQSIALYLQRLFPLFQTCIAGILCSYSTPELRSDLYVLANKFLQKSFENNEILKSLTLSIKSVDSKFIDIVCNDSIYAEGSPRVTSLLLLESLIHISSKSQVNFVLERLIKNNSLSLLVRSIKRTDEMMSLCSSDHVGSSGVTLNNLLYELTAFKATIYLLLRISATRLGASKLMQCELFPIIKNSKFLLIDPDLGLNLHLDESEVNGVKIHLSLDTPLSLCDSNGDEIQRKDEISYYEFLVPVFQLITGVLLSMGPSYKPSITQGKDMLHHFKQLAVGVVKRDSMIEANQKQSKKFSEAYSSESLSFLGLQELVKLIVLLDTLVTYEEV
ncbi:nucleoporin Nup192p [[Candida] anglica]|uniref:Nucleoporin Nup192p n=1 Tax=[Candida] anglica TaxID=148631 RepID=A0ABP0EE56_9ASCO